MVEYNNCYELCKWEEISKEYGYGWKPIAEFTSLIEAEKERDKKPNKYDYMIRKKKVFMESNKSPYFKFVNSKDIHKGLTATQRRELWNSDDPKDFKKLM